MSAQFVVNPTWQDNFRGRKLNAKIWRRSVTNPGEQLSGYSADEENVFLKRGKLHLKLIKVNGEQKPYRSGRIETNKEYSVNYGKLVIRAKAEVSKGVWPALWMRPYPEDKHDPKGEIDVLEYIDCWKDTLVQVNFHLWGYINDKKNQHLQYPCRIKCNVSEWHIYSCELYPDHIAFKIDDEIVYNVKKKDVGGVWPFGYDYQLLLAFAYGGWGGSCGTNDAALPKEFLIDYVKYYKIKE